MPSRTGRAARSLAAGVLAAALLSGCGTSLPLIGGPSSSGGLGITERISTIKLCASALNDIRAAAQLAAQAQAHGLPPADQLSALAAKLRGHAASDPSLAISRSLLRLADAIDALGRSATPAQVSAAATALANTAESVVTHCASVGS